MTRRAGAAAPPGRAETRESATYLYGGLAVLAAAALARLWRLSVDGLWVDEAYTAWLARQPLGSMLAALRLDDAPALFYLGQRAVVRLLGDSEAALRLLPAACGLGTVALAWGFCRRHAPRAALFSAAALGFSTLLVFYSRQARAYSLVHLLGTALLWAAISLRRRPSPRHAAAFAVAALGILYSHNLGVLLVASAALALVGELRRPDRRRRVLLLFAVLAAGAIPWAVRLAGQIGIHSDANRWMGAWWEQGRVLGLAPLYSWSVFPNGTARPCTRRFRSRGWRGTSRRRGSSAGSRRWRASSAASGFCADRNGTTWCGRSSCSPCSPSSAWSRFRPWSGRPTFSGGPTRSPCPRSCCCSPSAGLLYRAASDGRRRWSG